MALYLLDNEKGIKVQVFSTPKNVQGKPRPYCEIRWEEAGVTRRKTVTGENFAKAKAQEIFENLLLDAPADLDRYAVREFLEAKKRVDGVPFQEIVDFWLRHQGFTITAPQAVESFLTAQEKRELGDRTLATYRSNLGAWAATTGDLALGMITVADLDGYLDQIPDVTTRAGHRQSLVTLFRWARKKGYLPPELQTVAERTERPRRKKSDPVPFPVDVLAQAFRVLKAEAPELQLPFALGAFAGIRTAEIKRLRWSDFQEGEIWLSTRITKTGRRRGITIQPNLQKFIDQFKHLDRPRAYSDFQPRISAILADHGIEWVDNGLRKGFISHAVALYTPSEVSKWSGHSETMLRSVYMSLVSVADARLWFEISP